jgi:sigma-B regulation protein RsbU (phosphoserine phosphatase)
VFDLARFGLADTLDLSAAITGVGTDAPSIESACRELVGFLHANVVDTTSEGPALALVQCFVVRPFDTLPGELQDVVRANSWDGAVRRTAEAAVMLAAAGAAAGRPSGTPFAAVIPSEQLSAEAPTLAPAVEAMRAGADDTDTAGITHAGDASHVVSCVPDIRDSALFASWDGFAIAHGVRSVVTMAIRLTDATTLVCVLYSRTAVSAETTLAMPAMAAGWRLAMVRFIGGAVFDAESRPAGAAQRDGAQPDGPSGGTAFELLQARARADALAELVRVRQAIATEQSRRIEQALELAERRSAALLASQAALASSRATAGAILRAALDAIVFMDAEGRVVDWNGAAEAMFGYSADDARGVTVADLVIPPELRDRHRAGIRHYLATGEGPVLNRRVELTAVRRDGSRLPVELTVTTADMPESPAMFIAFIRDITERKNDRAALLASRERFAQVARTLQHSLLPAAIPRLDGLDVAAAYHPSRAGSDVGGDFYDVFTLDRHEAIVVLGDVCGKGPEAAALTSIARYTARAVASDVRHPAQLLRRVNTALGDHDIGERFCSMVAGRITPIVRGVRMTVCCGGHAPPIVVRNDGSIDRIGVPGDLLGLFDDVRLFEETVQLQYGDTIVFCTDGVTEAGGGREQFGDERVEAVLRASAGAPASAVVQALLDAALAFGGDESRDDIAILALRAVPPGDHPIG